MNYYLYSIANNDPSNVTFIGARNTPEEATRAAKALLQQWRSMGVEPYHFVVRYNPTNALVATIP